MALIGTRLYAGWAVQDSADSGPYVVYLFTERSDLNTLTEVPLAECRVEISAFSISYDTAWQVAEQVRQALSFFKGVMGGSGGVHVEGCLLIPPGQHDESQQEIGLHAVVSEFGITFQI